MPLWKMDHREVVKTFIEAGFITKIVTVNLNKGMRAEDFRQNSNKRVYARVRRTWYRSLW